MKDQKEKLEWWNYKWYLIGVLGVLFVLLSVGAYQTIYAIIISAVLIYSVRVYVAFHDAKSFIIVATFFVLGGIVAASTPFLLYITRSVSFVASCFAVYSGFFMFLSIAFFLNDNNKKSQRVFITLLMWSNILFAIALSIILTDSIFGDVEHHFNKAFIIASLYTMLTMWGIVFLIKKRQLLLDSD